MSRGIYFIARSKMRLTLFGVLVIALASAVGAIAYWTTTGTGSATASTGTLNPPTAVAATATAGSSTVPISWTASSTAGGAPAPQGYYVVQFKNSDSSTAAACGGPSSLVTGTSCSDTSVPDGTYHYVVTAVYHTWTATASSNDVTVASDSTPPTVSAINRVDASPTNAGSVHWAVTFSESVTGVDEADFALARSGVTGGSVTGVSGSGSTYTITASTGSGDGTLELDLVDDDSITDLAGNRLGGTGTSGVGDGSLNGQPYAVDKTSPSVSIDQAAGQSDPTNASPINFTVVFSESVTGFTGSDVTLAGAAGATVATVTGSGATYNVAVSGMVGQGVATATIAANGATDAAGNGNGPSTSTDNSVAYDTVAPTTAISFPAAGATSSQLGYSAGCTPAGICGTADDASGVNTVRVSIRQGAAGLYWNGTAFSNVAETFNNASLLAPGSAATNWDYALSLPPDATYTVHVQANDTIGNDSAPINTSSEMFTIDTIPPTVTLTAPANNSFTNNTTPTLTGACTTGDGNVTVTVKQGALTVQTRSATCTAGAFAVAASPALAQNTYTAQAAQADLAGNIGASSTNTFTVDTTAPSVTVTSTSPVSPANNNSPNVIGSAEAGSTVSLYVNNTCTSAVAATGSAASFASPGLVVSVADNSSTSFYAKATDAAGNTSACSTTSVTYVEDSIAPSAPSSVALVNGGGASNLYVNSANKASISIDVVLPAGSSSSDTVTLTVHDAGSLHTVSRTASATAGAGTVHFTALDLSGLNDGNVTMSATATDLATNASGATSNTASKDVVAPDAPSAVAINNGLGNGGLFINNTNKASVDYLVTIPSGANNSTSDTIKVTLTSGASVNGTRTPSNPGGSVLVSGIDAHTLTDGPVAVSAIATDLAGNNSVAKTGTTTKDVIAPANPTAVALTTGGGFINIATATAASFSVTDASNSTGDLITVTLTSNNGGTTATASTTRASTSPTAVTVDASGPNDGTITVTAKATDSAGNDSAGTASATVTKDTVAPTVTILKAAAQADPTNALPINFTITFSESVTGFAAADLTLSGTSGGTKTAIVSGSGTTYNVAVSNATSTGTVTALVKAAAAADAAGNNNTSTSGTASVNYDVTSPTVTDVSSSTADGSYNATDVIHITVAFSEPVTVTGTPQLTLNTTPTRTANYTSGSGTNTLTFDYTVQAGDTSARLDYASTTALGLNGGTIKDVAGNNATLTLQALGATHSLSANTDLIVDTTAPIVTLTSVNGTPRSFPLSISANITSVGGACGSVTGDSTTVTITITGTASQSGTASCSSNAWVYTTSPALSGEGPYSVTATQTDTAGNGGSSGAKSITVDKTAPGTPTAVSLANGGGAGNSYINSANKASVSVSVTVAENVSTDTVNVTISDGTHVATGSTSVTGTTVTVTGIDASSLTDGLANTAISATETDAAANTSLPKSAATNYNKDTVGPNLSLATIAPTTAGKTFGAGASGTTIFFQQCTVQNLGFRFVETVTDATSGAASTTYPDIATGRWTHNTETVSTPSGGPFTSSDYLWSKGNNCTGQAPGTPSGYTVSAIDNAGNTTSVPLTFTIDDTNPTVSLTQPSAAVYTNAAWNSACASTICGTAADTTSIQRAEVSIQQGSGSYWNGTSFSSAGQVWNLATGTTNWSYAFPASNFPADGSYTVTVRAVDTAQNVSAADSQTFTFDSTAPTVTSINRAVANPTKSTTVTWAVTFSESVTGVDTTDFVLARTGVTGGSVTGVTGSGSTYTVTAATGSNDGTLGLNLVDDDSITDTAGNKLGGTGTGNGNFAGQLYTIDKTAPTLASIAATNADGTIAANDTLTFTYSDANGVDPGSVVSGWDGTGTRSVSITFTNNNAATAGFDSVTFAALGVVNLGTTAWWTGTTVTRTATLSMPAANTFRITFSSAQLPNTPGTGVAASSFTWTATVATAADAAGNVATGSAPASTQRF